MVRLVPQLLPQVPPQPKCLLTRAKAQRSGSTQALTTVHCQPIVTTSAGSTNAK